MRVLVFHGYLLRGTGSNIYNASLVPALARLGHDVHLLCQDRSAGELSWVDSVGLWQDGSLRVQEAAGSSPGDGSVTVYVPDIGGLLPVYVKDEYEGFEVKTFAELSEGELDRYIQANVAAVKEVAQRAGGVDAALANHLVMGPLILARSGIPFAAKVHGSALEYTVKPGIERFGPYAREGMGAARAVFVGSEHTKASLLAAMDDPALEAKVRMGPPGVDTELFAPREGETPEERLRAVVRRLRGQTPSGGSGEGGQTPSGGSVGPSAGGLRGQTPAGGGQTPAGGGQTPSGRTAGSNADGSRGQTPSGSAWGRDPGRAAAALAAFSQASGPRVVFIGKLIVSKGIDLLLAAWPLVVGENPGARLLVVGFGEYAETTERLWGSLSTGDLDDVAEIATQGRALEGGEPAPLHMLAAFIAQLPGGYTEAAAAAKDSVAFAGRLEHDEVGEIVPACDALVFPSTFPEAFGMVAAEAAAAEVPAVSANHSGAAEVSLALAAGLAPDAAALVSFDLDDGAVEAIARCVNGWLGMDPQESAEARSRLRATASELWSWEGVARSVIDACSG